METKSEGSTKPVNPVTYKGKPINVPEATKPIQTTPEEVTTETPAPELSADTIADLIICNLESRSGLGDDMKKISPSVMLDIHKDIVEILKSWRTKSE